MTIKSALAACRSEVVSLLKSIVRLLTWSALICVAVFAVLVMRTVFHVTGVEPSVAFGLMFLSLLVIFLLAKGQAPDRITWIGVYAGIVVVGIVAVSCVPQWSGHIVATTLALYVLTPNILLRLALRRAIAGYDRAAAFYARQARLFHPSRQVRFNAAFLTARALGSIEKSVAGYSELALHATPEELALLNCWIPRIQGDWEGMLGQIRGATGAMSTVKPLEILALGELGRIDEMITIYAAAESVLPASSLPVCRLYVLAFGGRLDSVRSLLSGQLRFVRSRNKAYWIFIASQAAGTHDEDARHVLASYMHAIDDETFHRSAQRHLGAGPTPRGVVLSMESRMVMDAIEKMLAKTRGNSAPSR